MVSMARKRLVVLGAGPMGLYAAMAGALRGLDVTVLERDRIGAALLTWGGTRFFSPLAMNVPEGLRKILPDLPPDDALLTGPEMVERVLVPLSKSPLLYDKVRLRHRVVSVGRAGLSRKDYSGHPIRHERAFRVLVEAAQGAAGIGEIKSPMEYTMDADIVLDATGSYGLTNGFGSGGLPVSGEKAAEGRIFRRLGDLEAYLGTRSGGRILLVGHGHSAAHALLSLQESLEASLETASRNKGVTVTWSFRSRNQRPFRETAGDPLPERHRILSAANALAASPPGFLDVRRASAVASLEKKGDGLLARFASGGAPAAPVEIDAVAAFTGYRPDLLPLAELALDLSPVTEGTRGLHAALSGATDCLSLPAIAPKDLASGEPGFHLIGAKSYGRANTFLLRDGIRQVEMILDHSLAA
jgi:hypothetical protein